MDIKKIKEEVKQVEVNILSQISELQKEYPKFVFKVELTSYEVQQINEDLPDYTYYIKIIPIVK